MKEKNDHRTRNSVLTHDTCSLNDFWPQDKILTLTIVSDTRMPTTLNTKPEPNISSGKQRRNHALRKSRSVGGDIISSNISSRNITASPSLEVYAEEDNNGVGECSNTQVKSGTPCSGLLGRKSKSNASGKKGIGNIFKWFKQDRSNSFDIPSDQKIRLT